MSTDSSGSSRANKIKNLAIPLILGGIIIVSVIASISLYTFQLQENAKNIKKTVDGLKQELAGKTFYVNQIASQHLISLKKILEIMAQAKSFQTGEYDRIAILLDAAKVDSSDIADSFFILDKDGVLRYTTNTDPTAVNSIGDSFSNHITYIKTKETMRSFISPLTFSAISNSSRIYVASPIIDQQTGEFIGTVSAVIYADTFAKNIEKLVVVNAADAKSSSLSLLDAEGKIMYSGPTTENLGKHVLSEEIVGAIPPAIKESFIASLSEAVNGKSGIYELNLAEHPELNTNSTANADAFDYIMLSYAPVTVDDQIALISFVVKSASIHDALADEILVTSQFYLLIYSMLGVLTAFAVAIIVINKRLSRTVQEKTRQLQAKTAALEQNNKHLEEMANKLRDADVEKEEFSAMITHELKTPLVPVIGYSELLLDGTLGSLNEKQKETIQVMSESSNSLLRLIMDLLDARKLELGRMNFEKREIDSKILIEHSLSAMKPLAQAKGITLISKSEYKVDDNALILKCDAKRIEQVLNNLINNAIKFSAADIGKVELSVKRDPNDDDAILFTVMDNGTGIPKDRQQNIFKRFYQADTSMTRNAGGTGLGLAICKGIVEAHDGKIWFESEPGISTTFYFSIPSSFKSIAR